MSPRAADADEDAAGTVAAGMAGVVTTGMAGAVAMGMAGVSIVEVVLGVAGAEG